MLQNKEVSCCLLFLLLLAVSCKNKTAVDTVDGVHQINIPAQNSAERVSLEGEISHVEYIPLDNKEMFGFIVDLAVSKDYFFVHASHMAGVFQYDRSGKFIRKFALFGDAPGESNYISGISVNETEQKLYLPQLYKETMVYSFDGEYLGYMDCFPPTIHYVHPLKEDVLAIFGKTNNYENDSTHIGTGLYTPKGKLIVKKNKFSESEYYVSNAARPYLFNIKKDAVEMMTGGKTDTIFAYKSSSITPRYVVNRRKELAIRSFFDTPNYVYFDLLSQQSGLYYAQYSKKTGKVILNNEIGVELLSGNFSLKYGIENTIDYVMPIWPKWQYPKENILLEALSAADIEQYKSEHPATKDIPAAFMNVDEDSNPVLVVYHLVNMKK